MRSSSSPHQQYTSGDRGIRNPSRRQSTVGNLADVPHMVLPTLRSHVNPIKPKIVHIYTPSGLRISTTSPHGGPQLATGSRASRAYYRSGGGHATSAYEGLDFDMSPGNAHSAFLMEDLAAAGFDVSSAGAKYVSAFQLRPTSHAYSRLAGLQASAIYRQHSNQLHQPQIRDKTRGLRHFSMKVCQKVKEKRVTTYNEVADELVQEYCAQMAAAAAVTASHTASTFPASQLNRHNLSANELFYDHKNIRRRVYDAINVLMAMNIITKEKKEIRWIGFPSNAANECKVLQKEMSVINQNIANKSEKLRELILKYICYHQLIQHNASKFGEQKTACASNTKIIAASRMPLLVLAFPKGSELMCYVNPDSTKYTFVSDNEANMIEDKDILLNMGFGNGLLNGNASEHEITQAKSLMPKHFRNYVNEMGRTGNLTPIFNLKDSINHVNKTEPMTINDTFPHIANTPLMREEEEDNEEANDELMHITEQQDQDDDDGDDDDESYPLETKRFRSKRKQKVNRITGNTSRRSTNVSSGSIVRKVIKHEPQPLM